MGQIRMEAGEGEHASLDRLTVRCGAVAWRAVPESDGRIVEEECDGEPTLSQLVRRAVRAF